MRKILLHAGMPKTGTTSIQKFLFESSRSKQPLGFSYHLPFNDNVDSQHLLWGLFRPVDAMPRWPKFAIQQLGGIDAIKEPLESCLAKIADSQRTIISSEYLFMWSIEELLALKNRLIKAEFDKASVLLYVRNPVKFYLSMVQQKLKADSTFTSPYNFRTHYAQIIRKLLSVFEDIEIRSFEREDLQKSCVVQDFILNLEVMLDLQASGFSTEVKRENKSLSAEAMIFLQDWNESRSDNVAITPSSIRIVSLLQKSQTLILQTPPKLRDSIQTMITNNCCEDVDSLKEWNIDYSLKNSSFDSYSHGSDKDYSKVSAILASYNQSALMDLREYVKENFAM